MSELFRCPKCDGENCWRHEVDIGVGVQYGPWNCDQCGWHEEDDMIARALDTGDDEFPPSEMAMIRDNGDAP